MKSINRRLFIEQNIKIINKNSEIVPLILNKAQNQLYEEIKKQMLENKPVRIVILKARQLGISTFVEALFFTNTILNFNIKTGIITHQSSSTSNLFTMSRNMYYNLPEPLRPEISKDNQNELNFNNLKNNGLNSSIKCMTAGSSGVGRSSTYNQLHISEYAFWPKNKRTQLNGLIQSVPSTPGSMIIIESTPNGYEHFKEICDEAREGKNDFKFLFFPWYQMEEYRKPIEEELNLTIEEEELKEMYNLDDEQINWRRWCIKNNCQNDINTFKQEYPSNPEEAFLSTGKTIFDKESVENRLQKAPIPLKTGFFKYKYNGKTIVNYEFVESKDKPIIKIYEDVKEGYPYVLGGDTAGIGSDSFAGDVINNNTANQCATLEIATDETEYTMQMYCLGMYYNYALLAIETNYSTYPVKKLYEMGYSNQYLRSIEDGITIRYQDKLGVNTNRATRPVMIAQLKEFFTENIDKINDYKTLREALTFVKREDGKQAAEDGYHDDRIMSLAIAHFARTQQKYTVLVVEDKPLILPSALEDGEPTDNYYDDDEIGLEW
jgi:hypothetical protein